MDAAGEVNDMARMSMALPLLHERGVEPRRQRTSPSPGLTPRPFTCTTAMSEQAAVIAGGASIQGGVFGPIGRGGG